MTIHFINDTNQKRAREAFGIGLLERGGQCSSYEFMISNMADLSGCNFQGLSRASGRVTSQNIFLKKLKNKKVELFCRPVQWFHEAEEQREVRAISYINKSFLI